jgi:diguanylate cyclase (GGDEF)-like protein
MKRARRQPLAPDAGSNATVADRAHKDAEFHDHVSRPRRLWGAWQYYAALFFPVCILVGAILAIIYHAEMRSDEALVRGRESQSIAVNKATLVQDMGSLISDALFLTEQSDIQSLLSGGRLDARANLEKDYLAFAKAKRQYDQVRYLNERGREVVRIDFEGGKPAVIPYDLCEERSHSITFKEASKLERGKVYLSPMRLSTRSGKIEMPLKPVLFAATPVFDENGRRRGAIVLTFLAKLMLDKIQPPTTMLLRQDGHWLHGGKMEHRFGFQLPGGRAMPDIYPYEWPKAQDEKDDQFYSHNGLFSYATIAPLHDALSALKQNGDAPKASDAPPARYWKLISIVPPESLHARSRSLRKGLVWFYAVLVAIIGIVSLHYARLMARRREMQELLREYALTDSLTKTTNRRFGMQSLGRLMRECKRLAKPLTVFMVDVNNLKKVNDSRGHKAGDAYIQLVANLLRGGLRQVDVVARFGGDEFLVILPFTPLDQAKAAMQRMHDGLQEIDTSEFGAVHIGFSYGGAEYQPDINPPVSQLLDDADAAMYEHKREYKIGREFDELESVKKQILEGAGEGEGKTQAEAQPGEETSEPQ